jgi:hypothetical protein
MIGFMTSRGRLPILAGLSVLVLAIGIAMVLR